LKKKHGLYKTRYNKSLLMVGLNPEKQETNMEIEDEFVPHDMWMGNIKDGFLMMQAGNFNLDTD